MVFSCNSKKKEHGSNNEDIAQVVEKKSEPYRYTVIFEQREDAQEEDYPSKSTPADVSRLYYMDHFQLNHIDPRDTEKNDTLNIKVNRKSLLIGLTYFQFERFPYLIEANDTLRVQYKSGVPIVYNLP